MQRQSSRQLTTHALLVSTLTMTSIAQAQYDAHWVTGNNGNGTIVDFRTAPPTMSCGADMASYEGSATWSDALTGDLLVYSNGIEVRSPDGPLQNGTGLLGNYTATETALFVPVPGSNAQRLFVFSNNTRAVFYSLIDIPSSTVLGDYKNVSVAENTGEGMGAIAHENGVDFWLVVANTETDALDAYLVTGDPAAASDPVAFPSTPTTSTPLELLHAMVAKDRISVVFSPDSQKVVLPIQNNIGVWVLDFDNSSGQASSPRRVYDGTGYSAAFSPDSKMVYFAAAPGAHGYSAYVQQYNLSTEELTQLTSDSGWGGVALAPDGKIYATGSGKRAFTVIADPNVGGVDNVSTLAMPAPCQGGFNLSKQISLAGTTLIPCRDAGVGVQDIGCRAQAPVCEGSGLSASCVACEDNHSGETIDFGCSTGAPQCEPTSLLCTDRNVSGISSSSNGDGSDDENGGCCRIAGDGPSETLPTALLVALLWLRARRRKRCRPTDRRNGQCE